MSVTGPPTETGPPGGPGSATAAPPPRPPGGPSHRRAAYYRVPPRRRRWVGIAFWTVWALIAVAVGLTVGAVVFLDETLSAASPDTPEVRAASRIADPVLPGKPIHILLIGSDKRPGKQGAGDTGRSDSLILVRMNARQGYISMLSFPRDLYIPIPGHGEDRINTAYSFGGAAKAMETVKALTGEPVNYFMNIDFEGFINLVDEVGGVYMDVDRRYFNDNSGGAPSYATIDLQPGYQKLKGDDALDYVRYRHTDSDFARIARQQAFLSELKRQTGRFGNLLQFTTFARIFSHNVQTNLGSVRRLISLVQLALTTDKDRVARISIVGDLAMRDVGSVVLASPDEIRQKVGEWRDPDFEAGGAPVKRVEPATVDVVVRNGSGRLLESQEVARDLRGKRFAARPDGNAKTFGYRHSAVFYGQGQRDAAKAIQSLMGPRTGIAPLSRGQAPGADALVVVGEDYAGKLYVPPRASARPLPDTVSTTGLVPVMRRVQRATGMRVMAPLKVARGSRVRIVRPYRIKTGGVGPWAVKVVLEAGAYKYWGISEVAWEDPPIWDGETGSLTRGGRLYHTYYDGKNLQRLAWQKGGVTYWISNTLDNKLSADTMWEIAKSMRPLGRARLPRGTTDTPMEVETEASTP